MYETLKLTTYNIKGFLIPLVSYPTWWNVNKHTHILHLVCVQAPVLSFPFEIPQEAIIADLIWTKRKVLAPEDYDVSATGY
jgi:hypothetical protein